MRTREIIAVAFLVSTVAAPCYVHAGTNGPGRVLAFSTGDRDRHALRPARTAMGYGLIGDCGDLSFPAVVGRDVDNDDDGYSVCRGDCNDADAATYRSAPELCDGYDNDCDGAVDDEAACPTTCEPARPVTGFHVTDSFPYSAADSAVAWDGSSQYGVAWRDTRHGWQNSEIYFARLDAQGIPVGQQLRLTDAEQSSERPSVAWSGAAFGIVWRDSRDGNAEIYFGSVDAAGQKLVDDVRVTVDPANSDEPRVVWAGSHYGIVWSDSRGGNRAIYFARLDPSGRKLGRDIKVSTGAGFARRPSLTWNGTEYAVVWEDSRHGTTEIYFARLDPHGNLVRGETRVTEDGAASRSPSLVWSGEYGVAWSDSRDGNEEIYFRRIGADGAAIGTDQRLTTDAYRSEHPWLTTTGSEYGLVWRHALEDDESIRFLRLSTNGQPTGSVVVLRQGGDYRREPSLVWTGRDYGVTWEDGSPWDEGDVYFSIVGCD